MLWRVDQGVDFIQDQVVLQAVDEKQFHLQRPLGDMPTELIDVDEVIPELARDMFGELGRPATDVDDVVVSASVLAPHVLICPVERLDDPRSGKLS